MRVIYFPLKIVLFHLDDMTCCYYYIILDFCSCDIVANRVVAMLGLYWTVERVDNDTVVLRTVVRKDIAFCLPSKYDCADAVDGTMTHADDRPDVPHDDDNNNKKLC